jgi:dihydrolipoamide dehydrogenase
VISSSGALALTEVPERLVVVGGGYIGLELGTAYAKLGSAVTIVEVAHSVLPTMDADIARVVAQGLDRHGIAVRCGTAAQAYDDADGTLLVETPEGTTDRVVTDLVLVAVGRAPVVDGWGLDVLDLDRQGRFLRIDDRCRTSMAGVYAVGDLTGEPMLAHRAMAQGRMVAEVIAGAARRWDVACIPAVVFTDPEVIVVGRSAAECAGDGIEVVEGRAPFTASGRAHSAGNTVGFVRVVVDAVDHVVLGVQGVGSGISELAAVAAVLVEMAARLGDVDAIIQAHPTRGETIQEAARAARARLP